MTQKEMDIIRRIKGHCRKSHGKWLVFYTSLAYEIHKSIEGLTMAQCDAIIKGMERQGYIRKRVDKWTCIDGTIKYREDCGCYILERKFWNAYNNLSKDEYKE